MSVLQSAIAAASGSAGPAAYQIERSLRFNSADSAYLQWVPPQVGNRKTYTISTWVKRSAIASGTYYAIFTAGAGTGGNNGLFFDTSAGGLYFTTTDGVTDIIVSSAIYRDPSAWYHVLVAVDTTQATAANRIKMYVNGVQLTAFSSSTYPAQNSDASYINTVNTHRIGAHTNAGFYQSGYLTEFYFIDGQALTPSDFGETNTATGVWFPKAYAGTYGNNGFYLPFNDNSTVLNLGRNRQTLTADPYFPVTTLLLNGNGTNGAQNNTFLDSSSNNFTITRNGNTTQGTFSPFSQTGWSNYFDGSSAGLSANVSGISAGTSTFTLEMWVYLLAYPGSDAPFVDTRSSNGATTTAFQFGVYSTGAIKFYDGTETNLGGTVPKNQWAHIALVRNGSNVVTAYINGTATGTTVSSTRNFSDNYFWIASVPGPASPYLNAYISNLRWVVGTAVYTGTFTPSTTPLTDIANTKLLTCQSNRFVDTNTQVTAKTITVNGTPSVQAFSPFAPTAAYSAATNGGSGYFDGTGDYLSVGAAANWVFLHNSTAAWTMEFWVYNSTSGTNTTLLDTNNSTTGSTGVTVQKTSSEFINVFITYGSAGNNIVNGTSTIGLRANAWNHVFISYNQSLANTNLVFYINGVAAGTANKTANTPSSGNPANALSIGCYGAGGGQFFPGYIGALRISNTVRSVPSGVPTAPYTSDANTVLLANFTNAGILDATGRIDFETVGSAQISTTQSKFGGSSMYFDGTVATSRVRASSSLCNLGGSDFTVEFWYYPTANNTTGYPVLWTNYETWTGGTGLYGQIGLLAGNKDRSPVNAVYLTLGDNYWYASSTNPPLNTWTHIALVRQGNQFMVFINGVREINQTISVTMAANALSVIGGGIDGAGLNKIYGYIDDFRQTNYARYTGNFSVPTAQFAYNQADINVKQWVPNNFSVTAGAGNDSLVDSPTWYGTDTGAGGEVRGNYATLNPLDNGGNTIANGNLDSTRSGTSWVSTRSTFGMSSGKWYLEITAGAGVNSSNQNVVTVGLMTNAASLAAYPGSDANGWGYNSYDGRKYNNQSGGTGTGTTYGATWTTGDVIGIAFDADAGSLTFYKNGVSQGAAYTSMAAGTYFAAVGSYAASSTLVSFNFGQRPFAYTAPSGFKALCSTNLPTPAIGASASTLAEKNFNTLLWTGDNTTSRTITGAGFAPDFAWLKRRNSSGDHGLMDRVRGATARLISNSTAAEDTSFGLSAFASDGITTNSANTSYNATGDTHVGWLWKAGGTAVSNTAGSISSSVSANPTAGISVVTYTANGTNGATVGHGLGVAPKFITVKQRDGADSWYTYTSVTGNNQALILNSTGAAQSSSAYWNNTSPTSSVFSLGTAGGVNTNTKTYVAYCFAEVPGFSKFGSYTGNASTDGPFVYTGFRPKFVLVKNSSTTGSWWIDDSARDTYNVASNKLAADSSAAESTGTANFDFLSNGFKVRNSGTELNGSGNTIIFMAFAEAPLNYSRAR